MSQDGTRGWLRRRTPQSQRSSKKVVDELRNTVHNLASLLLKTQRCWETRPTPNFSQKRSLKINSR
ncbi:hypothetical protein C5O80_14180 [Burkholderia sp. SRS-46]|nr:hypothetical protein C5O80_29580 [Burkholderia sp. SRS-46]TCW84201.1 hypothetical protein C5O80_14180 [Burkholderia sp. SRS-46]